jgi:hypothetical protein
MSKRVYIESQGVADMTCTMLKHRANPKRPFDRCIMIALLYIEVSAFELMPLLSYGLNLLGSRGNSDARLMLPSFKNSMTTRSRPGQEISWLY